MDGYEQDNPKPLPPVAPVQPEFPSPESLPQGEYLDAETSAQMHAAVAASTGLAGPGQSAPVQDHVGLAGGGVDGAGSSPGRQVKDTTLEAFFLGAKPPSAEAQLLREIKDLLRDIKGAIDGLPQNIAITAGGR